MRIAPGNVESAAGIAGVHVRSWQAAYADILEAEFLLAGFTSRQPPLV